MGALGEKLAGRDVAIGVILSGALGFGLLFLHFYTSFATQVTALLFGNVLAVSRDTLAALAGIGAVSLVALALIARPLLFASLQPELAEAKGVSLRTVSVLFLAVCALAVAAATQIVGVLLVFTLLVGPAPPRRTCRRGCRPACCSPRCSRCSKRGSASRSRITPTGRRASHGPVGARVRREPAAAALIAARRNATPACPRAAPAFLMRPAIARAPCALPAPPAHRGEHARVSACDVIGDERRDEVVPVVVACMAAQRQRLAGLLARGFEHVGLSWLAGNCRRAPDRSGCRPRIRRIGARDSSLASCWAHASRSAPR
jgi:hypothetical protein